jgi:hypothetical protein
MSTLSQTARRDTLCCVKICGKSDKGEDLFYTLWRDWEYLDQCPVVHLLVYIYLAGIKSGCIFLFTKDLYDPEIGADGHS